MEDVKGVPLYLVWEEMGVEDRWKLTQNLARYEKAWASCSFSQFGSLYFSKDLDGPTQGLSYTDQHGAQVVDSRFAVGPVNGRWFSENGRSRVDFDRGPCKFRGLSASLVWLMKV